MYSKIEIAAQCLHYGRFVAESCYLTAVGEYFQELSESHLRVDVREVYTQSSELTLGQVCAEQVAMEERRAVVKLKFQLYYQYFVTKLPIKKQ